MRGLRGSGGGVRRGTAPVNEGKLGGRRWLGGGGDLVAWWVVGEGEGIRLGAW